MGHKDLSGKIFGRLKVIEYAYSLSTDNPKYLGKMWKTLCSCGNIHYVSTGALMKGSTKSCGCYKREVARLPKPNFRSENYNYKKTRLYSIWHDMKKRCYNKNSRAYKWYGAKGVKVCDEWKNRFLNFRNWATQNGYTNELSIERVNHNGNYHPSNCKWIPRSEQNNNKSNTVMVNYNGVDICLGKLVKSKELSYQTVVSRLKRGWSIEKAIDAPVIKAKKYEYNGVEKTVAEWANLYNLKYSVLSHRLLVGWTIEKALNTPVQKTKK